MLKERTEGRATCSTATWDTIVEARKVAAGLPTQEMTRTNLAPITFAKQHRKRGLAVIFTVGSVVGAPYEGVSLVPERTRTILEKMGIPYEIFVPNEPKS